MIVLLLAGCAKTMVVSMLSERVVLRVLLMLAEWASAGPLILRRTFIIAAGLFMADMITPNFSKSEMACCCGCGIFEMDDEFMRMLQELRN